MSENFEPELVPEFSLSKIREPEMVLLAQLISVVVRRGDVIALEGDLGAGKTTFARAFIRAFQGVDDEEIPSPTYTLVQTYKTPRMTIAHFDLYRLSDPSELGELGLEHALSDGVALIEWPSRGGDWLPESKLVLTLVDTDNDSGDDSRDIRFSGLGHWGERLVRLKAMYELISSCGWLDKLREISFLAGDASARRYARLYSTDNQRALVMDWPKGRDGEILREGKTYNQLAHIADEVEPFVAISNALRSANFSAPEIIAHDLENRFVVLEDLGDRVFFDEVEGGTPIEDLWREATMTLVSLRQVGVPRASMGLFELPRFDRGAMWSELELIAQWYWPLVHGSPMPKDMRDRFKSLWDDVIDRLLCEPLHWCLRDFHSPNLVWLPERSGVRQVGVIDFQDACSGPAAYDLVSLLQDARMSVPVDLESRLLNIYCDGVEHIEPSFDKAKFMESYAAMGAQRNTKILGIFARLAERDKKPHYLEHIPRIWGYLSRDLQHPCLRDLANWYEEAFQKDIETASLS